MEALTPYEQGRAEGQWTWERLDDSGFASVAECLAHYEASYEATVAAMRASGSTASVRQIEYWNGLISAIRESLGALLLQEGA